jgi:hypothetical protein
MIRRPITEPSVTNASSVTQRLTVGNAATSCIPVSEVNQAGTEDDAGTKAEADGTGATAEVNALALGRVGHCKGSR